MDRCLDIIGSLAEQLDQPMLNWVHSYMRAVRAQIAGDTDRPNSGPREALQIGTDSGQPDAALVLRRAARSGELPTRHLRRAGPTPRADGRRHSRDSPKRSPRRWLWPMSKQAESTTRVACWRSSPPPTSIFRSTRAGSPRWPCTPRSPSRAGTRSMPGRCSTGSRRGPIRCPLPALG